MFVPKSYEFFMILKVGWVKHLTAKFFSLSEEDTKLTRIVRSENWGCFVINDCCSLYTIVVKLRQPHHPIGDIKCLVQFVRYD